MRRDSVTVTNKSVVVTKARTRILDLGAHPTNTKINLETITLNFVLPYSNLQIIPKNLKCLK